MKLKKLLALAAASVIALSVAGCGQTTDDDLAYIKDNGKMIIGYTVIKPLNYTDDRGDLTGFETEFAEAVCEKLGVDAKFVEINWDSKESELNAKSIDCIWNGMTITDERKENMSISTPYLENRQVMVVKKENAEMLAENIEGATVIAEAGSAGEELMNSDETFAKSECTPVPSQATALMDVAAGTSDVAIIDYVMAGGSVGMGTDYEDLIIIDKDFESEEYGIAFRKGSNVTEEVNKIITELVNDGTLNKIAGKYGLTELLIAK
ncbi:MAG: transporter substrate-binding domain-containing protein [Clostridiales bacterium]|nr:transporter substrate-binding domain-containing protein [Clostridiales bacterium]